MAVYYTIKCPHCNQVVEQGKDRSKAFDSPLRSCRFCGNTYVDNNYIEAGLLTDKQLKKEILSRYSWNFVAFLFFAVMGLLAISKNVSVLLGLALIAAGVVALILAIFGYRSEYQVLQKKVRESNARLSDPHYVLALHKANIAVPKYLVEQAKKNITE